MGQTRTIKRTQPLTILNKTVKKEKTAVQDCFDIYGSFIWALARKFTASTEEAEAATQEIYIDIWRHAERGDKNQSAETLLIAQIARRRLIKYLTTSRTKSM